MVLVLGKKKKKRCNHTTPDFSILLSPKRDKETKYIPGARGRDSHLQPKLLENLS